MALSLFMSVWRRTAQDALIHGLKADLKLEQAGGGVFNDFKRGIMKDVPRDFKVKGEAGRETVSVLRQMAEDGVCPLPVGVEGAVHKLDGLGAGLGQGGDFLKHPGQGDKAHPVLAAAG